MAHTHYRNVLIVINDSPTDEGTVRFACSLAHGQKDRPKLYLIYVNIVSYQLPIDAEVDEDLERGESAIDRVTKLARDLKCPIETDLLQGRDAGPVVVAEAMARKADLIVMSAGYNTVPVPLEISRATKYVLTHSPTPVLLYAEPPMPSSRKM